ncbi:hypothetical protein [Glycomyces sp. NPDC021274]|uniref:hypothetical protein n=1 Tax=Glycomyces sp. NPDC021274 TaxID=3155120 RepID=UPI0033F8DFF7
MTYAEWTRSSAAYRAYVTASQRCTSAFQEETMTDQRYTVVEQTTERPASKWTKAHTVTKYVVTKAGKEPRSYDPVYTEREHAELHARIANAIPDNYSIRRVAPRASSIRSGYVWKLEGHSRDPRPCKSTFDESNYDGDLDRLAGNAIRVANEHAAGSGARIAEAEAEEILREAHAARRAELTAQKGELATPRQIDYIMSLLAQREISGEGGGFYYGPTTRAGVEEMSKAEASVYIRSLTGDY